ncbi:hypothetical protein Q765_11270 [Flavobacterium rivuli WB 3.3-2 = DSM 21788]|uniref:Carboxypeptidase regulatory-like domain-containing protein n=1 Tax=Flavobacterium rivuli WB 3.3-2 = DSM 21788 TaxID=1121895 RepID=A0A0A2M4B0_9FLAO|nr:hypothetical protein [Flavobacterium rivuli]KGO86451.1 hypothetical protein Q765_11270 [Flavobacterium rivuli WB 3.3-2 = DSM 21788]
MKKWLFILLVCTTAFCQERKPLQGKVITGNTGISNIFVINKATGAEVKTDALGGFAIPAKPGDKIAVYSNTIEARDFAISEKSFIEIPYVVEVDLKGTELKEVVVEAKVTSQSLGLVPKNYKFPTPAERRAKRYAAAVPGFGISYVINALSGNLYMLRLAAKYAEKEVLIQNLGNIYTEDEITAECGVPKEYAKGFLYYAADNQQLADLIKVKDTGGAKLLMNELGLKYLEVIKDE